MHLTYNKDMKKQNMQKGAAMLSIIIGIIIVVVVIALVVGRTSEPEGAPDLGSRGDEIPGESTSEDMTNEKMMDDDVDRAPTGTQSSGSYEVYSEDKLARANSGDVVLFFHATWCPSCRAQESDIVENEMSIPNGVSILKVDYDSNVALRQKYGVRVQHTFVQVDADGNQITQWSGGTGLDDVLKNIQ